MSFSDLPIWERKVEKRKNFLKATKQTPQGQREMGGSGGEGIVSEM